MRRILGKKMKKLWNLKRKGVGKEIFEFKEDELEGEWSISRIWKSKKGNGELEGIWEKFWELMKKLW